MMCACKKDSAGPISETSFYSSPTDTTKSEAASESTTTEETTTETTSPEELLFQKKQIPEDLPFYEEIVLEIPVIAEGGPSQQLASAIGFYDNYIYCFVNPFNEPESTTLLKYDESGNLVDRHKFEDIWTITRFQYGNGFLALNHEYSSKDSGDDCTRVGYIDLDTYEFHKLFELKNRAKDSVSYSVIASEEDRIYLEPFYGAPSADKYGYDSCHCYDYTGTLLYKTQDFYMWMNGYDTWNDWFVMDDIVYVKKQQYSIEETNDKTRYVISSEYELVAYADNGLNTRDVSDNRTLEAGSDLFIQNSYEDIILYDEKGIWTLDQKTKMWDCFLEWENTSRSGIEEYESFFSRCLVSEDRSRVLLELVSVGLDKTEIRLFVRKDA